MERLSVQEIKDAAKGDFESRTGAEEHVTGISVDTRTLNPGDLFVALTLRGCDLMRLMKWISTSLMQRWVSQ